jgi:hypothetical protein
MLMPNAAIAATVNVFAKLRFIMISFVFLYSSGEGCSNLLFFPPVQAEPGQGSGHIRDIFFTWGEKGEP